MRFSRVSGVLGLAAAVVAVLLPSVQKKLKPLAKKVGKGLVDFADDTEKEPEAVPKPGSAAAKAAESKAKREGGMNGPKSSSSSKAASKKSAPKKPAARTKAGAGTKSGTKKS